MSNKTSPEISGLHAFDPEALVSKMRKFGTAGLGSVHAVFDFDLTLTTPSDEFGRAAVT